MFFSVSRRVFLGTSAVFAGGLAAAFQAPARSDSTSQNIHEILLSVRGIEADLGIKRPVGVDPVGNFPVITDKHRSLTCKALKANPELYSKYCNVRTPMGFTFDQAIQAGIDAPHLGVGIAAGEAAAYDTYKDIMDIVIGDLNKKSIWL